MVELGTARHMLFRADDRARKKGGNAPAKIRLRIGSRLRHSTPRHADEAQRERYADSVGRLRAVRNRDGARRPGAPRTGRAQDAAHRRPCARCASRTLTSESNSRSCIAAGSAGPELASAMIARRRSSGVSVSAIQPLAGVNERALSNSLSSAWAISSGRRGTASASRQSDAQLASAPASAAIALGAAADERGADRNPRLRPTAIARSMRLASLIARTIAPSRSAPSRARARYERGLSRQRLVIEIVERGLHDRERRIEFVRQLRCERAQIVGVGADLVEQLAETAREVAELVGGIDQRHRAVETGRRCASRARRHCAGAGCGSDSDAPNSSRIDHRRPPARSDSRRRDRATRDWPAAAARDWPVRARARPALRRDTATERCREHDHRRVAPARQLVAATPDKACQTSGASIAARRRRAHGTTVRRRRDQCAIDQAREPARSLRRRGSLRHASRPRSAISQRVAHDDARTRMLAAPAGRASGDSSASYAIKRATRSIRERLLAARYTPTPIAIAAAALRGKRNSTR